MHVVFSPEARAEFEEGERYYNRQLPGLGRRFRQEVQQVLRRARSWPMSCPVERGAIRRVKLSRFPYKLLYSVETDHDLRRRRCPSASRPRLLD